MKSLSLFLLGALLLGLASSTAYADRATALDYYREGMSHYRAGSFQSALQLFEQAYREDPAPTLKYNIGQAHWKLGNYQAAISAYRQYLAERPNAANRQEIEQRIAELEQGPPPPPPASTVQPRSGAVRPLSAAIVDAPPAAQPVRDRQQARSSGSSGLRTAAFIAGGVGVVSLGGGLVFGALTRDLEAEVEDANRFDEDQYDKGKSFETYQLVLLSAGALATVTSAVLFIIDAADSDDDVAISPILTPYTAGIAATGGF